MRRKKLLRMIPAAGLMALSLMQGARARGSVVYMCPRYSGSSYIEQETIENAQALLPDISIHLVTYSEEQYYTVLKTRLALGKGPDLFFVQPDQAGFNGIVTLAQSGYLAPITEFACIQEAKDTAAESSLLVWNGEVYGVSLGRQALGVQYNKKFFEENNLEVPGNWQEFLECCEVLKENGIQPFSTFSYLGLYQIAANVLYAECPDYNERLAEGTAHFTDEGTWDEVLERYFSFLESDYVSEDAARMGNAEAAERFYEGKSAMYLVMARSLTDSAEDSLENEDYGFFPLPGNEEGTPLYCTAAEIGAIGLYSGSENSEESKAVLECIVRETLEEKEREISLETLYPSLKECMDAGRYFPPCNYGWKNEVEVILYDKIAEYVAGGDLEIQDITEAMQKEYDRK